jgi:hypothetical protein
MRRKVAYGGAYMDRLAAACEVLVPGIGTLGGHGS